MGPFNTAFLLLRLLLLLALLRAVSSAPIAVPLPAGAKTPPKTPTTTVKAAPKTTTPTVKTAPKTTTPSIETKKSGGGGVSKLSLSDSKVQSLKVAPKTTTLLVDTKKLSGGGVSKLSISDSKSQTVKVAPKTITSIAETKRLGGSGASKLSLTNPKSVSLLQVGSGDSGSVTPQSKTLATSSKLQLSNLDRTKTKLDLNGGGTTFVTSKLSTVSKSGAPLSTLSTKFGERKPTSLVSKLGETPNIKQVDLLSGDDYSIGGSAKAKIRVGGKEVTVDVSTNGFGKPDPKTITSGTAAGGSGRRDSSGVVRDAAYWKAGKAARAYQYGQTVKAMDNLIGTMGEARTAETAGFSDKGLDTYRKDLQAQRDEVARIRLYSFKTKPTLTPGLSAALNAVDEAILKAKDINKDPYLPDPLQLKETQYYLKKIKAQENIVLKNINDAYNTGPRR